MSFKSLNHILSDLEQQSRWQEQPFQRLLKFWTEAVGAAVAAHTRPLSMQRNILWVATSSSAWAQNLTFERQRILQKLNPQLSSPLADIRFSPAQWQCPKDINQTADEPKTGLWREHPSSLINMPGVPQSLEPNSPNPNTTFYQWAKVIQARSQGLPLCPQCHCPTPKGELQRWTICSICAAKQW